MKMTNAQFLLDYILFGVMCWDFEGLEKLYDKRFESTTRVNLIRNRFNKKRVTYIEWSIYRANWELTK
jgi:hypothetical protein